MVTIHVVDSAQVAAVLARGRGTQFLGPYFGRASSIAQAARELEVPLAKAHYWTQRWHDLGLLRVTRTVPRAGRSVRLYRTVADTFEVPPELLPEALLDVQLARAHRELLAGLQGAAPEVVLGGVLRISKPPGRRNVSIERATPPGARPTRDDVLQTDFVAALSAEEARRLRSELDELRHRWLQRSDRTGTGTHLVMLALTPLAGG